MGGSAAAEAFTDLVLQALFRPLVAGEPAKLQECALLALLELATVTEARASSPRLPLPSLPDCPA